MTKKKIHPVIHHGVRTVLPAGLGTFGGFYLAVNLAIESLGKITETEKSFQACIDVIQTISIFG